MTSIDSVPDDVLLALFTFYMHEDQADEENEKPWRTLVHVCRRWRSTVFGSPRHLGLQLVCTDSTRARDSLDIWPALPLIIRCHERYDLGVRVGKVDNILAALERHDRVREITVKGIRSSDLEMALVAMQQPFPELTQLILKPHFKTVPLVPDSFLCGSAPSLRDLRLTGISFLGLPKLLLSATHLAVLYLDDIPHSGYISPDTMVSVLSTLTSLYSLTLLFQSPRSCPDQASRRPSPSTRSVLPALNYFWFKGVTEYLEDLVACIDAPQLNYSKMTFFNDIVFDTPQSIQFITRTPALRALEKAHITLWEFAADVNVLSRTSGFGELGVKILCRGMGWQVSSLEQVCTSALPPLSTLEDLYIYKCIYWQLDLKDNIENRLWLELLHPFAAVKNLYLSEEFALRIVPALQELSESRTMEVLPCLQNIFLEGLESSGPVNEGIGQFVAARQVVSHPIAVSRWANSQQDKLY